MKSYENDLTMWTRLQKKRQEETLQRALEKEKEAKMTRILLNEPEPITGGPIFIGHSDMLDAFAYSVKFGTAIWNVK